MPKAKNIDKGGSDMMTEKPKPYTRPGPILRDLKPQGSNTDFELMATSFGKNVTMDTENAVDFFERD